MPRLKRRVGAFIPHTRKKRKRTDLDNEDVNSDRAREEDVDPGTDRAQNDLDNENVDPDRAREVNVGPDADRARNMNNNNAHFEYVDNDVVVRELPEAMRYDRDNFVTKSNIGNLTVICNFCRAITFQGERAGLCCNKGKIVLDSYPPPPEDIRYLFINSNTDAKHFLANIKRYNSAFQMTSLGCDEKKICRMEPTISYSRSIIPFAWFGFSTGK